MGAKAGFQSDVKRLFEGADQLRGVKDRLGDGRRMVRFGTQIAFAFSGAGIGIAAPLRSSTMSHSETIPSFAGPNSIVPRPPGLIC